MSNVQTVSNFNDGDIIFREGDKANELFFIMEGTIEISKKLSDNSTKVLAKLEKGDFFGEMSAFTDQVRVASAKALGNTKLLVVPPDQFNNLISKQPEFGLKVVKTLCQRLKQADLQITG